MFRENFISGPPGVSFGKQFSVARAWGRPPRARGGRGCRCHDNMHTHDYVRPVYTLRWYWTESDGTMGKGPALYALLPHMEGPKTIGEAELQRRPSYAKGLRVKGRDSRV